MKRQYVYEVVREKDSKVYDDFYFSAESAAKKWAEAGKRIGCECTIYTHRVFSEKDIY